MHQLLISWLDAEIKKAGKSKAGLAKILKVSPSTLSRMLSGARQIELEHLPLISSYLEQPLPKKVLEGLGIVNSFCLPLVGTIAPEVWRGKANSFDVEEYSLLPLLPNSDFSGPDQIAYQIDVSVSEVYQEFSHYVVAFDCREGGSIRKFANGDLLVLERYSGDLIETSLWKAKCVNGFQYFEHYFNKINKTILTTLSHDTVRICGVVIGFIAR